MLLSTFSHYNGLHFLCNMYVLWSFSDPIVRMFGKEQFFGKLNRIFQRNFTDLILFLAVFLSGGKSNKLRKMFINQTSLKGVISSWLSYVFKVLTKTPNISLGAVSIRIHSLNQ